MKTVFRKTGIDVLGDMPWGIHICHFYHTPEELSEIILSYIKTGLENNESCMCITSQPLEAEEVKAILKKEVKDLENRIKNKQLTILDYNDWYVKSRELELREVAKNWINKEREALRNGFEGLRIIGNVAWLKLAQWKAFMAYEQMINYDLVDSRILAICSYPINELRLNQIKDLINRHDFSIVKEGNKWTKLEQPKGNSYL